MKIFDYINQLTRKTDPNFLSEQTEENQKIWNTFQITRFLSYNYDLLPFSDYLNGFHGKISDDNVYRALNGFIPKKYYKLNFPKKSGKVKDQDKVIDYICKAYKVPYSTGKEYINQLSKTQIEFILQQFGMNEEDIQKIL